MGDLEGKNLESHTDNTKEIIFSDFSNPKATRPDTRYISEVERKEHEFADLVIDYPHAFPLIKASGNEDLFERHDLMKRLEDAVSPHISILTIRRWPQKELYELFSKKVGDKREIRLFGVSKLEFGIGLGDILGPHIGAVSRTIYDAEQRKLLEEQTAIGLRNIKNGRIGYFTDNGEYLEVYSGYSFYEIPDYILASDDKVVLERKTREEALLHDQDINDKTYSFFQNAALKTQGLSPQEALKRIKDEFKETKFEDEEIQKKVETLLNGFDTNTSLVGLEGNSRDRKTLERIRTVYGSYVISAALKYGVPPNLLFAIIATESNGVEKATRYEEKYYHRHIENKAQYASYVKQYGDAVSSSWGLCQIMYPTALSLGFEGSPDELTDPQTNIDLAAKYIAEQRTETGLIPVLVATAYNTGKVGGTPTSGYVERFMQYYIS